MGTLFEKSYFVNSKVSNYKDYRVKKFTKLARDLAPYLTPRVVDFGCATGGLIHALKKYNIEGTGTDISFWAIEHGKEVYGLNDELKYYSRDLLTTAKDCTVLFIDTLEHIPQYEIEFLLSILRRAKPKNVIIRLPVSRQEGRNFVLNISRNDKTHINVHPKGWWKRLFKAYGFRWTMNLKTPSIYNSEGVLAGCLELEKNNVRK